MSRAEVERGIRAARDAEANGRYERGEQAIREYQASRLSGAMLREQQKFESGSARLIQERVKSGYYDESAAARRNRKADRDEREKAIADAKAATETKDPRTVAERLADGLRRGRASE